MIPYTKQGYIDQRYRTDQTNRWTRPEQWGATPVNGPNSFYLFMPNIRQDMTMQWYIALFDYFTQFEGVIQAEMNQRGGPPFLHVAFETHQHAKKAKRTINI